MPCCIEDIVECKVKGSRDIIKHVQSPRDKTAGEQVSCGMGDNAVFKIFRRMIYIYVYSLVVDLATPLHIGKVQSRLKFKVTGS